MNIKYFILGSNYILEEFAKQLREEIWLLNTLLPKNKIKLRYLDYRNKMPISNHDIEVAKKFLKEVDC